MSGRTLPGGMSTDLAASGTQPRYLVELGYPTPLYFYSGTTDQTYNNEAAASVTWTGNGVSVTLSRNFEAATVVVPNNDNAMSTVELARDARTIVPVYISYREGSNTLKVFDGYLAGAPTLGPRVTLQCTSTDAKFANTPRVAIAPPTFNHLIPSGTLITWGKRKIRLTRAGETQ